MFVITNSVPLRDEAERQDGPLRDEAERQDGPLRDEAERQDGPLRDEAERQDEDHFTDTEIYNGQSADRGEWPWSVLVKIDNSICGGVLMSKQYVLTVASCVM